MSQETAKAVPASANRRRKRSGKWIVLVLVAAGLAGWYLVQRNADTTVQDQPLIATVERGNIENTISSAGSLKPSSFVDVGAQVSGQLEKLHVAVGDRVEAEQLLAEIDARTQESRVDASRSALEALEAQIASRQASLDLAEANARRVNPHLTIFRVSATTGEGMSAWLDWIEAGLEAQRGKHGESVDALKARIAELERQLAAK